MKQICYVISGDRVRGSATILLQLTATKWAGFFIPKYSDLLRSKTKAICSNLTDKYIKNLLKKLPKRAVKYDVEYLDTKAPFAQYNKGILKTSIKIKTSKVLLTFVRGDHIKNFKNSKNSWLVLRRKSLTESESPNESPTCLFIKGNPKYWIKGVSNTFYKKIAALCRNAGYLFITAESDVHSSQLPAADVVIGFSRGTKYLKLPIQKWKHKIAIGANPKNVTNDVYVVNNPDDRTEVGDLSKQSLINHWTLTDAQVNKIKTLLLKFKNEPKRD